MIINIMLISNFKTGTINIKSHATQTGSWIIFDIKHLKPMTLYNFNICIYGDLREGYKRLGGHWNPHNATHGIYSSNYHHKRDITRRHAGDLQSYVSDKEGNIKFKYHDPLVISSKVVGRSIVISQNRPNKIIAYSVIGFACS